MAGVRRNLINAIHALMVADDKVTVVVKAINIVKFEPPDVNEGGYRPRINIKPGDIDRVEEYSAERLYNAEVIFEMTVDLNEASTLNILNMTDVVFENKDAFIYNNNSRVTGIPENDSASIIDDGDVLQPIPVVDTENRIVTAELIVRYSYHQSKT